MAVKGNELIRAIEDLDFSLQDILSREQFTSMLAMRIQSGWDAPQIARKFGVKPSSLNAILYRYPEAKELWDQAKALFKRVIAEEARNKMIELMRGGDEKHQFAAAKYFLDRLDEDFAKKATTGGGTGGTKLVVQIVNQGQEQDVIDVEVSPDEQSDG